MGYFKKILVVIFFITLVPAVSSFCLQTVLGAKVEHLNENSDACEASTYSMRPMNHGTIDSMHHNAILPCCVNTNNSELISYLVPVESIKFIQLSLLTYQLLINPVVITPKYHAPILIPPDLVAHKITVIRV